VITLRGEHIYVRALEPEDLDTIYKVENEEGLWNVGETLAPLSRYILKEYLANAHEDIYEARQLRLVICNILTDDFIGLIDLYDFDPHNLRAGIGILIAQKATRNKGYGEEALEIVKNYCNTHLKIHQLYAGIEESNMPSIALFEKAQFKCVGLKKDWKRIQALDGKERYTNEFLYQYIF